MNIIRWILSIVSGLLLLGVIVGLFLLVVFVGPFLAIAVGCIIALVIIIMLIKEHLDAKAKKRSRNIFKGL